MAEIRKSTRSKTAPINLYQSQLNDLLNKRTKKKKRRGKSLKRGTKGTKKNVSSIRIKQYKSKESKDKFFFKNVVEIMRVTRTIGHPPHDYQVPLVEDSVNYDIGNNSKLVDEMKARVSDFFTNPELSGVSEEEFTNIVNAKEGREFKEDIRQSKLGCVIMEFNKLINNEENVAELNVGEAIQTLKNEDMEPEYGSSFYVDNGKGKRLYFTLLNMAEEGGTELFKHRIPMKDRFKEDKRTKHYYGTLVIHNGNEDYQENHKLLGIYYSPEGLFILARYSINGRYIDSWINLLDRDVFIVDDRKDFKEFLKIIIREQSGYYKMVYFNNYGEAMGGQFPKYLKLNPLTNKVDHKSMMYE